MTDDARPNESTFGASPPRRIVTSIASLLVAGLVRLLVVILFEAPVLGMVLAMRFVRLAFAHTLLLRFVFRVILTARASSF